MQQSKAAEAKPETSAAAVGETKAAESAAAGAETAVAVAQKQRLEYERYVIFARTSQFSSRISQTKQSNFSWRQQGGEGQLGQQQYQQNKQPGMTTSPGFQYQRNNSEQPLTLKALDLSTRSAFRHVSGLHCTCLVPGTRASSDDVDGFLTLRVDPLEEGCITLRAWPNRLARDGQGPSKPLKLESSVKFLFMLSCKVVDLHKVIESLPYILELT
ncbi:hypothetical protein M9H77_14222 [Catharanthus roseus]|uniref:Uncharacterized protein n=1 Tax=Catharanthus roseus TaxID=4058 RepID=A0ACC0BMN3_CATRO|nr:hypothetical protein M9H77_14222 [Catharanthus roseus]